VFESLDYLYLPSRDVAADLEAFSALGARVVFAIEAMGTRVAMVESPGAPGAARLVLAGHLDGDSPIFVFRVDDLEEAGRDLEARGWRAGHGLEIPQGPVRAFETPGGKRIAIYELTRPGVIEGFEGRRDF
jgi:hypothetical protein